MPDGTPEYSRDEETRNMQSVIDEVERDGPLSSEDELFRQVAVETRYGRTRGLTASRCRSLARTGCKWKSPPIPRTGPARQATPMKTELDPWEKADASMPPRPPGMKDTFIPAGESPVELSRSHGKTVLVWAEKVLKSFASQGERLAPSGLYYLAGLHFDFDDPELVKIQNTLTKLRNLRRLYPPQPDHPADKCTRT